MMMLPTSRRVLIALLLAYAALHGLWTVFHWGGSDLVAVVGGLPFILPSLVVTALTVWRARHEAEVAVQRGWWLVATALAFYSLGLVIWGYYTISYAEIPFPSIADPMFVAFPWLFFFGLMYLTRSQLSSADRRRVFLNTLIMVGAVGLVQWVFLLRLTVGESARDLLTLVMALLYPIGDLVMLGGLIFAALLSLGGLRQPFLLPMLGGVAIFVIGNLIYAIQISAGSYQAATPLDFSWALGLALFGVAVLSPARASDGHLERSLEQRGYAVHLSTVLTQLFLVGALATLVNLVVHPHSLGDGLLVFAVLSSISALIFARQVLEIRENTGLTRDLQEVNSTLEARIRAATGDLARQNRELSAQATALEKAGREAEVLRRLSEMLAHRVDPGELAEQALRMLAGVVGVGGLSLWRLGGDGIKPYALVGHDSADTRAVLERGLKRGEGRIWEVVASARPLYLADAPSAAQALVPLSVRGQTVEVLVVVRQDSAEGWTQQEKQLLEAAATTLALALERSEFVASLEKSRAALDARNQTLQEQARSLAVAARFERTLTTTLGLFTASYNQEEIFRQVLRHLAEQHPYPAGAIYSYNEWNGKLELAASHAAPEDLAQSIPLNVGVVGQAAADRRSVVVQATDSFALPLQLGLTEARAAATLVIPLYYQERVLGAMVLASTEQPSEVAVGFLSNLGGQIGIALQTLQQYTSLQDLSRKLQTRSAEVEAKNAELERANKLKGEFLASMSHELRTPLTAIIGFSEVLEEGLSGLLNEGQASHVADIRESGQHLLSLINDILDLSKIESGTMTLDKTEVDIPGLLESSLVMIRESAMNAGLGLELKAQPMPPLSADSVKLKQVVFNLVSNAVKFTPKGGRVIVSARNLGDAVEIAVEDTGIGIAPEDQVKLFHEFVQVDGSLARRHEGTGLGLALSKRLVDLHGGSISVKSVAGQGSTFTVTLPGNTLPGNTLPGNTLPKTPRTSSARRRWA